MPMSKALGELVVKECKAEDFQDCDIIFSGLDSDVAGDIGTVSLKSISADYNADHRFARTSISQGKSPRLL